MKKITYLIVLLFIAIQSSFSQEKHSRITINNPSQSTLNTLAEHGIDLRCGISHDDNNGISIDVSEFDRNILQQNGISYTTKISDLQSFYSQRAANDMPRAIMEAEMEDAKTIAKRKNELSKRGSVSSTTIDNYLQYQELNEKDWVKPLNFELGQMAGCLTVDAMEKELDEMRAYSIANGLNIVSVKQDASSSGITTWGNPSGTITNNGLTYSGQGTASSFENDPDIYTGKTFWDPQTMWYVRITGNDSGTAEGSKPQMLFTSMIHAREVSALMNNMYFMWYLIENYDTDPAIKNLVDNNELYFIPVVNPDGLRWNEHLDAVGDGQVDDGSVFQRKNLRPNTGGTGNTDASRGVDINRNFDYFWGSAGTGSSGTPTSDSYRGPNAESEPETQIIKEFVQSRNFKTAIWNHSFANSIPHPYGGNPNFVSGREDEMHEMHSDMTKYNRYVSGATIFSASNGIADDWMLGGNADTNGSIGSGKNVLATTPEHGSEGFWPTPSTIIPIAKRSVRISLMGAYYGGKYAKFHDLTQSDILTTSPTLDFAIERIGQTASDFTLTVTPISANIITINSPATQSGMAILEQRTVSASMTLAASIQPNDKIEYKVELSNDNGVFYEVNIEKFYQPTLLFSHNPDASGLTGWTQTGWNTTSVDAYSGSNSLRTGNTVPYANSDTKTLTTSTGYDLSNSDEVLIQFYTKWDIERNFDLVELQASTNGTTWTTLSGKYSKPKSSSNTNDHALKAASNESFQGNNSSGHIYDGDQMDNWVMEEIVINATDNNSVFEASNVIFRFRMLTDSNNAFENYSANAEGFFIDDFKIINIQIPCELSIPSGSAISLITDSSAEVNWDNIPSATFDLRYRETGSGTWIDIIDLTSANYSFTALNPLTEYEVQVRSSCEASDSNYSTSLLFTTTDVINCSGTLIGSFPYLENFDSGLGDWIQNSGDSGDWTLDASGTPSTNTGPSDDITGGGNYLFTEASTNGLGFNATVFLTSSCYDFTNLTSPTLSFYYHMFGDNLGSLNLEVSSNNGITWTNIFSRTGVSENLWKLQNIDLSNYKGKVVKFRFTGITGNGFSSDIAIDEIRVGELPVYCDSFATDIQGQFSIRNVNFNTINNNDTTADVYSDFTSLSTIVSKSTTYNISITPRYTVATSNAVGYRVWIDYNRDGDFIDAGEQVFSVDPVTGGNPVNGTITIPSNVINGKVKMRVSMKFYGTIEPNNQIPCESFQYGEVEDYTINLFNGLLYSSNTWTPSIPTTATAADDIMILDGVYNTATDINVNSVTVNTGAEMNINKVNSITVNGNITNNGNFVLNSDSNEFSSLLLDGTVTGGVKYKRHVNANTNRNDLIAPPVSGEIFTDFLLNNPNIQANVAETEYLFGPFDKSTSTYITYSNTETSSLETGKGYRAASTDNTTFTFNGNVTTTAVSVPIANTGTAFAQWNLIGNPYTAYIKLEDFINANINEFNSESVAVYGYDADNTDNGSYWTIRNLAYAAANPNSLIAPGQGFFVSSKAGGGTMAFTPSMRSNGSSDDFISGRTSSTTEHFTIKMNSSSKTFGTELYVTDNASLGLDLGYDAEHFDGRTPSNFAIYSELVENNTGADMAIQAFGPSDVNDNLIVPLGINALEGEQITISLGDDYDFGGDIYLEDTVANTFTLLNTSDYTITPSSDLSNTGRFYLRFSQNVLSVNDSNLDNLQVYADSKEQIVVKGQLNTATQLILYDIQGRQILRSDLNISNLVNTVSTARFTEGVYLVQLSNRLNKITKKIIIK